MVTHTRNLCSAFIPSKVHTHSSEHTHTPWTHRAVGSHLCCGARGADGGSVSCSRVSPQSWYWWWRERCTFTPPTYNSCWTWDSNPQPMDYKSDSLTIRPWLPPYLSSPQPPLSHLLACHHHKGRSHQLCHGQEGLPCFCSAMPFWYPGVFWTAVVSTGHALQLTNR